MLFVLELLILIFSSWTATYHFMLLSQWPSKFILLLYPLVLTPLMAIYLKLQPKEDWTRLFPGKFKVKDKNTLLGVGFGFLFLGFCAFFISRPDADDFTYFHRALWQINNLRLPFSLHDVAHNASNLPPFTILHLLNSYEVGVTFIAKMIGADALWMYQNFMALGSLCILPIIYFLLYQELGLKKKSSIIAAGVVVIFLLLDGNMHRSFGSWTFLRSWQGKSIFVMNILPLTLLFSLRFLKNPSPRLFVLLSLISLVSVGLTGSSLFLLPLCLFGISIAYLGAHGYSKKRLIHTILLNCTDIYIIVFIGFFIFGIFTNYIMNASFERFKFSFDWFNNIRWIIHSEIEFVRNVLILFVVPFLSLERNKARFIVILSVAFILIFANPLTAPFFYSVLSAGLYWRLIYLFPLPLCAGLLWEGYHRLPAGRLGPFLKTGFLVLLFFPIFMAFKFSVFHPYVDFKNYGEYKFPKNVYQFSKAFKESLVGKNVLAPEEVTWVLGLMEPSIQWESTRYGVTRGIYQGHNNEEGLVRIRAQVFVARARKDPKYAKAFGQVLDHEIDVIIIKNSRIEEIKNILDNHKSLWSVTDKDKNYSLFSHQK